MPHSLFEHPAVQGTEGDAAVFQHGDLTVLQQIVVLCVFDDRRHVGGDKHLALSLRDDQRTLTAHGIDRFGMVGKHDAQRKRTAQLVQHPADAADGIAIVVEIEQLRHHLGVGVGQKLRALVVDQKLLELLVVFDNAVVYDGHAPSGMGV